MTRKIQNHRLQNKPGHQEKDSEHRQSQHNLSKETGSLFLSEMIAKLERTPRIKPQTMTQHKTPTQNRRSNNKHKQRVTLSKRM